MAAEGALKKKSVYRSCYLSSYFYHQISNSSVRHSPRRYGDLEASVKVRKLGAVHLGVNGQSERLSAELWRVGGLAGASSQV